MDSIWENKWAWRSNLQDWFSPVLQVVLSAFVLLLVSYIYRVLLALISQITKDCIMATIIVITDILYYLSDKSLSLLDSIGKCTGLKLIVKFPHPAISCRRKISQKINLFVKKDLTEFRDYQETGILIIYRK